MQWVAERAGSEAWLVPDEFRHQYRGFRLRAAPADAPLVSLPVLLSEAQASSAKVSAQVSAPLASVVPPVVEAPVSTTGTSSKRRR